MDLHFLFELYFLLVFFILLGRLPDKTEGTGAWLLELDEDYRPFSKSETPCRDSICRRGARCARILYGVTGASINRLEKEKCSHWTGTGRWQSAWPRFCVCVCVRALDASAPL